MDVCTGTPGEKWTVTSEGALRSSGDHCLAVVHGKPAMEVCRLASAQHWHYTLKGNLNWLKSHEIRMSSDYFGELAEDIKPIVLPGSSDSAALDNADAVLIYADGGKGHPAIQGERLKVLEALAALWMRRIVGGHR